MRVFVTGGSGLVGRHVIEALKARGDEVVALTRSDWADAAVTALGAEALRAALSDKAALARGIGRCDAAVHAAALVLSGGDWAAFHAANVAPVEVIGRICARAGKPLVHISSVAVYGRATTYEGGAGTVDEGFGLDRPLFPGDHYARSKREAEQVLWRVAEGEGLAAVALRPCVVYGEGDRNFSVRLARVLRRPVAPRIGDGANTLSCIYAGNVAAAVLASLDRPSVTGAFNVANEGALSARTFVARFAAGLGVRPRFVTVPRGLAWRGARAADTLLRALRPGQPMTTLKTAVQWLTSENPYVSAKAGRELGWAPVVAPDEAAERTGRWYRDPAGS